MTLPELFKLHLKTQKVSPVTQKNYLADVNHFFRWLAAKTGIRHEVAGVGVLGLFTQETLREYKTDLAANQTPLATTNRRLSALRKFGEFSVAQGWIAKNEAILVENQASGQTLVSHEVILTRFKIHLERQKASKVTIKNYLSDLRHFLNWLNG